MIFNKLCKSLMLKWIIQCHKDVYQKSILRLEYAYLLFNKLIMKRIISLLIKIGQILTSFSVTKSSCDDTLRVSKKKIRKAVLEKYANKFCHHFDYKLWVCDIKRDFKMQ